MFTNVPGELLRNAQQRRMEALEKSRRLREKPTPSSNKPALNENIQLGIRNDLSRYNFDQMTLSVREEQALWRHMVNWLNTSPPDAAWYQKKWAKIGALIFSTFLMAGMVVVAIFAVKGANTPAPIMAEYKHQPYWWLSEFKSEGGGSIVYHPGLAVCQNSSRPPIVRLTAWLKKHQGSI